MEIHPPCDVCGKTHLYPILLGYTIDRSVPAPIKCRYCYEPHPTPTNPRIAKAHIENARRAIAAYAAKHGISLD